MLSGGAKYISPYTDFGFKKLFGTEVNKDLLKDFLNELIAEKGKIERLSYLLPEQVGRNEYDRKAIFDIYCETTTGEKFIVEMQCAKQKYFKDRSLYYTTFPIQAQAPRGDWNYGLTPVYFVGILNFVFDEDTTAYCHREVKLMDTKAKEVFYDKLTFVYLEMPRFNKTEKELETHFDKWMYVLKHLPELESRPAALRERIFGRLFRIAEIAALSPGELQAYQDSLKVSRDNYSIIETSREEGLAKGKAIGLEEGKILGLEEGKIEIARNLLSLGIPVETIAKSTGLLPEKIEVLKKAKG